MRLLSLFILFAISVLLSGCVFVPMVKESGVHQVGLTPKAVWTNEADQLLVECNAWDSQKRGKKYNSLGKRYVCGSLEAWTESIRQNRELRYPKSRFSPEQVENFYLRISVSEDSVDESFLFKGGFYLYPPNIKKEMKNIGPPKGLAEWKQVKHTGRDPYFPVMYNERELRAYIEAVSFPEKGRQYKDWYWYPNQILLPVAYAGDIALIPLIIPASLATIATIGH